jgi:2-oxoglutarate dehydrogenase E1 component
MDTRKDRTTTCLTFQLIRRNQFFKLNEAVSLRTLHTKYGQKTFSLEGESIIPALDTLIEKSCRNGSGAICNGNGTSWPFEYFGKHMEIYTRYFRRIEGKDYDKEYFDGDVKYHLGLTADKQQEQEKININLPNPSHLETVGAVIEGITRANKTSISQ